MSSKRRSTSKSKDEYAVKNTAYRDVFKWWFKLSNGGIVIVYKNGTHEVYSGKFKTLRPRLNDIKRRWDEAAEDPGVSAIVWSPISRDAFSFFWERFLRKIDIAKLRTLNKNRTLRDYIFKNYRKFFTKNNSFTKKDYVVS